MGRSWIYSWNKDGCVHYRGELHMLDWSERPSQTVIRRVYDRATKNAERA